MSSTPPIHVFFGGNSATIIYHVADFQFVTPGFYVNGPGLGDAQILAIDKSVANETTITLADDAQFQEGDYTFSSPISPPNIAIRPRTMNNAIQFWWYPSGGVTQYCLSGGNPPTTVIVGGAVTTAIINGIANSVDQSFYLIASNAEVGGFPSYFRTVQPGLRPYPPQTVNFTQTGSEASITWAAPVSEGGSIIRYFFVHGASSNPSDPDLSGSVYRTTYIRNFTGLNPASAYYFQVKAINDVQHSLFAGYAAGFRIYRYDAPDADTYEGEDPIGTVEAAWEQAGLQDLSGVSNPGIYTSIQVVNDASNPMFISPNTTNFGLRIIGYFNAPTAATYTFKIATDDGAILMIDGSYVIGTEAWKIQEATPYEGSVALSAGLHTFKSLYYQYVSAYNYQLAFKINDGGWITDGTGYFLHYISEDAGPVPAP